MTKNYEIIDYMFPEEELRETFPTKEYDNYLYHYTNLDAILSIIKKRELWLFGTTGLNDTSEGMLLFKKLTEIASTKQIKENIIEAHTLLTQNTYISSFSKFGNLLTLWRGYGNVAIGFDYWDLQSSNIIEDRNGKEFLTSELITTQCDYLDKRQIEEYAAGLIERYENSILQNVYQLLTLGSVYFDVKHPAFLDEREARIVCYLYDRKPFTIGKKLVLPFFVVVNLNQQSM